MKVADVGSGLKHADGRQMLHFWKLLTSVVTGFLSTSDAPDVGRTPVLCSFLSSSKKDLKHMQIHIYDIYKGTSIYQLKFIFI